MYFNYFLISGDVSVDLNKGLKSVKYVNGGNYQIHICVVEGEYVS